MSRPAAGSKPPTGQQISNLEQLWAQPGWKGFSRFQRAWLERRPYVVSDTSCTHAIGKTYDWFRNSSFVSKPFKEAIAWVKANMPKIPPYDEELVAAEAQHYLVQVLRGEVEGDQYRIAVAKELRSKTGTGPGGKGGRKIFRADDAEPLTGFPSQFSQNGAE